MDKENLMPIVLGSADTGFVRRFAAKYGVPVAVLDTKRRFRWFFSPSVRCIKMNSELDEIVVMYIASLLEGTDRMPLLAAADEKYRALIERNRESLSSMCILWHENFEF